MVFMWINIPVPWMLWARKTQKNAISCDVPDQGSSVYPGGHGLGHMVSWMRWPLFFAPMGFWSPIYWSNERKTWGRSRYTWWFKPWPFWDGENVTLFKGLSDLQRSGMKRSRIESPGIYSFLWDFLLFMFPFVCLRWCFTNWDSSPWKNHHLGTMFFWFFCPNILDLLQLWLSRQKKVFFVDATVDGRNPAPVHR